MGDYPTGASRDGVMDMAGNASEWCTDTYRDYVGVEVTDPIGTLPSPHRVIRGGSWYSAPGRVRAAERSGRSPGMRNSNLGFRLVSPGQ